MSASRIEYSEKYADDDNEYRCVEVLVFGEIKNAIRAFWLILSSLYLLSIQMLFLLRHVILPKELAKSLPKSRLLTESEWRGIGVQQSRGWHHYAIHR